MNDMPNIIEAAKAKEPYKIFFSGFFTNPIKEPKVCPIKIKNTINNTLFIMLN